MLGLICSGRQQELNDKHADALKKLMSRNNQPAEDAAFISIDRLGTDVRIRHGNEYSVERLGFDFVSLCWSRLLNFCTLFKYTCSSPSECRFLSSPSAI